MEFEVKVDQQPKYKEFLDEVTQKLTSLTDFKKTFQKFDLSVTAELKKVVIQHKRTHVTVTHNHTRAYSHIYTYTHIYMHADTHILIHMHMHSYIYT